MNNNTSFGTITWNLIHTLLEKMSTIVFDFENTKYTLFSLLKDICLNMPYHSCNAYYVSFFSKININNIKNMSHFKNVFFLFHNFINSKIQKKLFTYDQMSIYSSYNINNIFFEYKTLLLQLNTTYYSIIIQIDTFMNTYNMYDKLEIQKDKPQEVIDIKIILETDTKSVVEPDTKSVVEPDTKSVLESDTKSVVESETEVVLKSETEVVLKSDVVDIKKIVKSDIYKNISIIDDSFLPSFKLSLAEAMLQLKINPKCVPFDIYLKRWTYFNTKYNETENKRMQKVQEQLIPKLNDSYLPELTLSLPLAIAKIKKSPNCVPNDAYIKRWNELYLVKKVLKK